MSKKKDDSITVIATRHGRTDASDNLTSQRIGIFSGYYLEYLGYKFDEVYSSPSPRCSGTAVTWLSKNDLTKEDNPNFENNPKVNIFPKLGNFCDFWGVFNELLIEQRKDNILLVGHQSFLNICKLSVEADDAIYWADFNDVLVIQADVLDIFSLKIIKAISGRDIEKLLKIFEYSYPVITNDEDFARFVYKKHKEGDLTDFFEANKL